MEEGPDIEGGDGVMVLVAAICTSPVLGSVTVAVSVALPLLIPNLVTVTGLLEEELKEKLLVLLNVQ